MNPSAGLDPVVMKKSNLALPEVEPWPLFSWSILLLTEPSEPFELPINKVCI
jgi:hypothetical protein